MAAAAHRETAIEPDLPILDAHHHLWDDLTNPLATPYPLPSLLADLHGGHRVVATIYAECSDHYYAEGPEELRPVGETASIADRELPSGIMAGIVGYADLRLGAAVEPVLQAHRVAGRGRFRGVRFSTAWDPNSDVPNTARRVPPGILLHPAVVEGVRVLASLGMTFDGWMYFHQIPELIELARAVPEAKIVLDHLGGPVGIGTYARDRGAMLAQWRHNITEASREPNIAIKIGGLGFPWFVPNGVAAKLTDSDRIAAYWRPEVDHAIDAFGAERCMVESDFPVDGRLCDYVTLWNAFKKLTMDRTPEERSALFVETAARVYGVPVPETGGAGTL